MSLTCFFVFFGCLGFHTYIHTRGLSLCPVVSCKLKFWVRCLGGVLQRAVQDCIHTYVLTCTHMYIHRDDQKIRAPYIHKQWKLHKRLPLLPRFCATSGRLLGTIHFCFLWTAFRRQIWAVHFLWRRSCTSEAVQGSLRRFNKIPNYTVPGEIPNVTQSLIRFLELLDKSQCHFAPFLEDGRWLKPQNAKGVEKGLGVATRAWR